MGVTSVLLWKDNSEGHQGGHEGLIKFHDRITTTLLGSYKESWNIHIKLFINAKTEKRMNTTREMESILERLKNLWQVRQHTFYEGKAYIIGDFLVRVAAPKTAANYKGMLVEVEYISTINPYAAAPILREFIEMLKSPEIDIVQWEPNAEDSFSKIGLSEDTFTRAHTDYQYMKLFKKWDLF
ncbi:4083_t:CDS:2 [Funneliformis caledonium]|uniref:Mediator of RNA polymerase II transcription subunit 20 n=1 Tax=Funneliformis caledonium TaxID=1117310 RepID=A0A9N9AGS7_9GLOM|nr:4083_t:CDS:2 [Funneliformis caledonium]